MYIFDFIHIIHNSFVENSKNLNPDKQISQCYECRWDMSMNAMRKCLQSMPDGDAT